MYARYALMITLSLMACVPARVAQDDDEMSAVVDLGQAADIVRTTIVNYPCGKVCGEGESCCNHGKIGDEFPVMACEPTQTYEACGTCEKTASCDGNFPNCCPSVSRFNGGIGCTNVNGDVDNCGKCGVKCDTENGELCSGGRCQRF